MNHKLKFLLPVLLVLGLVYGGWQYWPRHHDTALRASGTLESTPIDIASRLGGRVTLLTVEEGQLLKKGQVLLRFDARDLEAQLEQLAAQETAAKAQWDLLKAGSRAEDIQGAKAAWQAAEWRVSALRQGGRQAEREQAQAALVARQSQWELAEKEYNRLAELVAEAVQPQQKLDQALQGLETARMGVVQAQKALELLQQGARHEDVEMARQQALQQKSVLQKLQRGVRPEELTVAQANLQQVQAQRKQLEVRLQEATVFSPCDCRLSVLGVKVGEVVGAGVPVMTLLDPQDLWLKVYLSPLELKAVRLQQPVALVLDAWPDRRFGGKVVSIASQAEFTPRNIQTREERVHQVFAVKVKVAEAGKAEVPLFAGLPADVIWGEQP